MIRITYITITYNAAAVLQRTLDSVLNQDYPHITHLIIDGASKDETLQMAEAYQAQSDAAGNGHCVSVFSEPDKGIYDAMNKGLRKLGQSREKDLVIGDYVCFLNAGDFLPAKDVVSRLVATVEASLPSEQPVWPAVLYGNTDIVDGDGRFLHHRQHTPPERLTWKSFRHGMLVCHQAFYARTDLAVETQYDTEFRYSSDVDWCIRIMKRADALRLPLKNLKMVVANYTKEGQTTLHRRASLRERYRVMERHYGRVQTFLMHCWFAVRLLFTSK